MSEFLKFNPEEGMRFEPHTDQGHGRTPQLREDAYSGTSLDRVIREHIDEPIIHMDTTEMRAIGSVATSYGYGPEAYQ